VASAKRCVRCSRSGLASKIIFANTIKSKRGHPVRQRNGGFAFLTCDNETRLYKIAECYPGAHIVIRIKCQSRERRGAFAPIRPPIRTRQSIFYGKAKALGLVPKGDQLPCRVSDRNVEKLPCRRSRSLGHFQGDPQARYLAQACRYRGGFPIPHSTTRSAPTSRGWPLRSANR